MRVSGSVDLSNRDELADAITMAMLGAADVGRVTVDLRGVGRIGPAVVDVLTGALRRSAAHGITLTIVGGGLGDSAARVRTGRRSRPAADPATRQGSRATGVVARLGRCDHGCRGCGGDPPSRRRTRRAWRRSTRQLLGWPVVHEEPGTAVVAAPGGSTFFVFQQADGYRAPVWPPVDGEQRPMMHLDFQVGDLDVRRRGRRRAGRHPGELRSGESRRSTGHPFCLCLDED